MSKTYLFLAKSFSTSETILFFSAADTFWLFAFNEVLKCFEEVPDRTGVTFIGAAILFDF